MCRVGAMSPDERITGIWETHQMSDEALELAERLLEEDAGQLEELRVHMLEGDDDAQDEALEELCAEFERDFDRVVATLSEKYGAPARTGEEDDDVVELNGVFRFAVWPVGRKLLYAAAAHEDRELPMLLMSGYR